MCWSATASLAMVGVGTAATIVTWRRGDPTAIPVAVAYFTFMEALQAAGYGVVDQCGSPANRTITALSYLHIAFQPLIINAFCMAIAPVPVSQKTRNRVFGLASLSTAVLLLRLVPIDAVGPCQPGDVMCGVRLCLVSGNWHIAWEVPLNSLWQPLNDLVGYRFQFPTYLASVFLLPMFYGVWRFAVFHAVLGPVLAWFLTDNPNEMPAIWCLFSVGLILVGTSPAFRTRVFRAHTPALA